MPFLVLTGGRQQIDANSMPFDFDPLSLDFPALTLECLQPPPTLFSSTQHPTSTSWSVTSPGRREFEALRAYFQEQFKAWKVTCLSSATDVADDLTYPPSHGPVRDKREHVRKAEKSADHLEQQVNEHLQSAYVAWETLPAARQTEVWVLEMARSVGRKHKEIDKMKSRERELLHEVANVKQQVEQLNRLQQPKEFKMLQPRTFPMDQDALAHAFEQGVKGASLTGFSLDDKDLDLSNLVSKSIERWKTVVMSARASGGMGAQRPLETNNESNGTGSRSQTNTPQQQTQTNPPPKRRSTASTNGAMSEQPSSANTTAPPSVEETSDQDADAEMEDDEGFAMMSHHHPSHHHSHQHHQPQHSPQKQQIPPPMQQQASLEVPRQRAPMQQQIPDQRFMMQNGAGSPVNRQAAMNLSRSMPNINMAAMQGNGMHANDMSMALQGMRGDAMYME